MIEFEQQSQRLRIIRFYPSIQKVNRMSDGSGFQCSRCEQYHDELPFAYGPEAPAIYFTIPAEEVSERTMLSPDLCVIDQEHFFLCGNLELPIIDSDQLFSWDVWVSISKESFKKTLDQWENPEREHEPPMFGLVATTLPTYPESQNLKANVHPRAVGRKPFIELEPTDHPLAVEQREGIPLARVQEIAEMILHTK